MGNEIQGEGDGEAEAFLADPVVTSLAAFGAPLLGVPKRAELSLEETLVKALPLARKEVSVLCCLPILLGRHADRIWWERVELGAQQNGQVAVLGLVLELTATFARKAELSTRAQKLREKVSGPPEYFFALRNPSEGDWVQKQTPELAKRWGFWMELREETLRNIFESNER
jgi:hypothetical protein